MPEGQENALLLFHRVLSTCVRTLLRAGFTLLDVIEPNLAKEMLARYLQCRDGFRMSHFVVLKAQKT
jgi:hypothetical protein